MNALVILAAGLALFALAQKKQPGAASPPVAPGGPDPIPDQPKPPSDAPAFPEQPSNIREPNSAEIAYAAARKNEVYYDLGDEIAGGQWYKLVHGALPFGKSGGTFRFADLAVAVEQGFYIVARDAANPQLKPRPGFPWKYYAISQAQPMKLLVQDRVAWLPDFALVVGSGEWPPGKWIAVTSTGERRIRDALGIA